MTQYEGKENANIITNINAQCYSKYVCVDWQFYTQPLGQGCTEYSRLSHVAKAADGTRDGRVPP